ncbi:unnamed protein product [Paramecium sonneborni]|uniref:Uncharacterized protein n=1 Tax=Paramecium sonneborni TaxID=65129 RepID=A0A8S1KZ06_9CILI|nr:unnamed protein product [Paramecium sonneborni]
MNNLVGNFQKYRVSQMNSDLPFIQNRKQIRAISLQQIFDKVKQNSQQVDFNLTNLNNFDNNHKIKSKNLKFENYPQTERQDIKLRSQSMTNRLQRSKGSEIMLTQIDSKKYRNTKQISQITYNSDTKIQKQGFHLKKIENNIQLNNDVSSSLFNLKQNKQCESDQKFNNLIHSTNNLLSQISEKANFNKIRLAKQNDLIQIKPEGPLLSFRQFAQLQGFKLPTFFQK